MKKFFQFLKSYFRWLIWQEDGYFSDAVAREMHDTIMSRYYDNEEDMYRLLEYFGV